MNRAVSQASRSVHLEQARQRLRQRFESKFLDAMTKQSKAPAMVTMPIQVESPNTDLLEEARLRIRNRFHEKFPPSIAAAPNVIARPETVTPSIDKQNHLEEARLRIHERFTNKFPDFKGFPVTVDNLQKVISATDWGKSNAVVVTSATPPYPITKVNKAWEGLCGFTEDQVRGKTFRSLGIQGDFTDATAIQTLSKKLSGKERAAVSLTNAAKDGTLFRNYLRVAPLYSNDEVTHFIGVLQAEQQSL